MEHPLHDPIRHVPVARDYLPGADDIDAGVQGYVPMPDIDSDYRDYYETHKDWLRQIMVQKYSKVLVKKGAKKALSLLTVNVSDIIVEAPSLSKTSRHLAAFNTLLASDTYECLCPAGFKSCHDILHYLIRQKSKKLSRKIVSMVPGVSTVQSVGSKGRTLYKVLTGTRGQQRGFFAHELHDKTKTCSQAQAMVAELLGSYHMQRCWAKMCAVRDWDEGWQVIEEKMASS